MNSSDPFDRDMAPIIDTSVAHTARVWNYIARAVRGFLTRAVWHLAAEARIRQFLDIGTGLPTANNTHEVAQATEPTCRIVYVDNDPLILAHARALLTSSPQGLTDYIHADLCEPDTILTAAARTLDFTQPIALMLLGVMEHILGLVLLDPGIVSPSLWRPEPNDLGVTPTEVFQFCGVGRKP